MGEDNAAIDKCKEEFCARGIASSRQRLWLSLRACRAYIRGQLPEEKPMLMLSKASVKGPHTHADEILMTASVGFMIFGTSRSSSRTSRGPYRTAPRMIDLLGSNRVLHNFRCQDPQGALAQRAN